MNLSYNYLNLLSEVSGNGSRLASYSYLSDGTKLRVRDGSGVNGFDYLGSLIYRKSSAGIQLDGVSFGDGRIVAGSSGYEVNYFLTDHLGSVRSVVNGATGGVKEQNDYYPFGGRYDGSGSALSDNRFKYNGKEEQTTGDLKYLDYGARMYDAELGRWFGMDPMAEKYYGMSGYNYCGNNPILFIDPDGQMMDWYENGNKTALLWQNSKAKEISISGETFYNVGSSMSLDLGGFFLNYYQNVIVSLSSQPLDPLESLLNNPVLLSKLLSNASSLSDANKLELFINSIHKGQQDFLNHPITQGTIQALSFVATGGIEGVMALGGVGKSLIGNVKVPIYRVFGGESRAIGTYWSLISPKFYGSYYRNFAGLPIGNSGTFTIKAITPLKNINFRTLKVAAPLDGNFGRLVPELQVHNKWNISVTDFWINF